MNSFSEIVDTFVRSLEQFWHGLAEGVPVFLAALALLLLGWGLARIAGWLTRKFFSRIGFDDFSQRFNFQQLLEKAQIKSTPSQLMGRLVFWTVMLIFFVGFADFLGWQVVSEKIAGIVGFIPRLLAGMAILAAGLYIATWVRRLIVAGGESAGLSSARLLGTVAQYVLVVIIALTTLEQIGVNIDLIKSNVVVLVGGAILAFGLGYGLGARQIVANMLGSFYARKKFVPGQVIIVDQIEGRVEQFDSTSLIVRTADNRLVVIPAHKLSEEVVQVLPPSRSEKK